MRKAQCLRLCWYQRRLNFDINTLYRKESSSIAQINGDVPVFSPTKWEIRRGEKLFESLGPRAVLHESGVKINKFTKLEQLPEVVSLMFF
jgi:hypothetical protein